MPTNDHQLRPKGMLGIRYWSRVVVVLAWAVAGWPHLAAACQVPVFRYALEYWTPDEYQLLLIGTSRARAEELQRAAAQALPHLPPQRSAVPNSAETSSAQQRSRLSTAANLDRPPGDGASDSSLPQSAPVNLQVRTVYRADDGNYVSLDGEPLPEVTQSWLAEQASAEAILVAPNAQGAPQVLFRGDWPGEKIRTWIDSPARQELVQRILRGDSLVWLLVRSGDAERDQRAEDILSQALPLLQQQVQLPPIDVIEADDKFNRENQIPLHVAFSTLSIDRHDATEQPLLAILKAAARVPLPDNEPWLIPVFGRARVFPPLVGDQIQFEQLLKQAQYICGACSCEIKQENPGGDLLLQVVWPAQLGKMKLRERAVPMLTGLGAFEALAEEPPSEVGPAVTNGEQTSSPAEATIGGGSEPSDVLPGMAGGSSSVQPPSPLGWRAATVIAAISGGVLLVVSTVVRLRRQATITASYQRPRR